MKLIDMTHRATVIPGALHGMMISESTLDPDLTGEIRVKKARQVINSFPRQVYMLDLERGPWGVMAARHDQSNSYDRAARRETIEKAIIELKTPFADAPMFGAYMTARSEWWASLRGRQWLQTVGVIRTADVHMPTSYLWEDTQSIKAYIESIVQVHRCRLMRPMAPVVSPYYGGQGDPLPLDMFEEQIKHIAWLGCEYVTLWMATHQTGNIDPYLQVLNQYTE